MIYSARHAAQALEIMRRLSFLVPERKEYVDLIMILEEPTRWKEAHDQFSAIRRRVTLPFEEMTRSDSEAYFAYVAECAAKTAYNCSGASAPFDEDSFEWLLRSEREFLAQLKKEANQPLQRTATSRRL